MALVAVLSYSSSASGTEIGDLHESEVEHVSQQELLGLVQGGEAEKAFEQAFELGDELFEVRFNAVDGAGANVGNGQTFTRTPRADLDGPGEWANHMPPRATGPNGLSCDVCHNSPVPTSAGGAALNNIRDPLHSAIPSDFINRQLPHLMGSGGVQLLAEEMTTQLMDIQSATLKKAQKKNRAVTRSLKAKGVKFGSITAYPDGSVDTSEVEGVSEDLVVRPFDWKGVFTTLRTFNRDAAHQELGMQPVETTGDDVDGDFDGVVNELTIGDITALALYSAGQTRPTTKLELAKIGLLELTSQEKKSIRRGKSLFKDISCTSCHTSSLTVKTPIFNEPSLNPYYRDARFLGGQDPVREGVDPRWPVSFDITKDQPDNHFEVNGETINLGAFEMNSKGRAIVRLYGDLKRHDMGADLAEGIDGQTEDGERPFRIPAEQFLTENLWGVGDTSPYLHDGRATTLAEAILMHGGEAESSRDAFDDLETAEQQNVIAFLNNLVIIKEEPGEEGAPKEVQVCHKKKTLSLDSSAVPAHLKHGDTIGACYY